jgi:hypothetical protein
VVSHEKSRDLAKIIGISPVLSTNPRSMTFACSEHNSESPNRLLCVKWFADSPEPELLGRGNCGASGDFKH